MKWVIVRPDAGSATRVIEELSAASVEADYGCQRHTREGSVGEMRHTISAGIFCLHLDMSHALSGFYKRYSHKL